MAKRALTLKKEYFTPSGQRIKRFIRVGGKIVPIVEDTGISDSDKALEELFGKPTEENAERSIQDRIDWINAENNHDPKNADRKTNCQRCVIAAELNARGYDVCAMPRPKNDEFEFTHTWLKALGKGKTIHGIGGEDLEEVGDKVRYLEGWLPVGARGVVYYQNKQLVKDGNGAGHVIMIEKTPKGLVWYDPQTAKIFKNMQHALTGYAEAIKPGEKRILMNAHTDFESLKFVRTDTAKIDTDMLKKYKVVYKWGE